MTATATSGPLAGRARHHGRARRAEAVSGWIFTAPTLIVLGIFLAAPVVMAAWVSLSDWSGVNNPFSSSVSFVGGKNYAQLLSGGSLAEVDFATSLRNNLWYVVFVVPLQTALSLALAVLVNAAVVRGRGFFRTAFYFPSVTSSVAITVLWLFLFSSTGAVNGILSWLGINGPNWFNQPAGLFQVIGGALGIHHGPALLTGNTLLGLSYSDWLAGPSIAMCAYILMGVFTTSGTFMLLFLAALQNLSTDIDEAAMLDGAGSWARFWRVTLPQLRPTLFTVLTLGLIGTWQVFDQIYTGTKGAPANTTLTPAYLSYVDAFNNQQWGIGSAIAFILFGIIVILTILQRIVLRDRKVSRRRMRWITRAAAAGPSVATLPAASDQTPPHPDREARP
ncbi:carbohydrate ABC transporter permease [Curtobacterium ammoniigenes]|uniref:carbohydrate ABC transporter permease n=1 Tax=Curtobacterium ammoniigenes TaxID=395387 RepID=UPI000832ADE0|nr:sugar ABC transporter permease [Curtobacterium ammoniigenes]